MSEKGREKGGLVLAKSEATLGAIFHKNAFKKRCKIRCRKNIENYEKMLRTSCQNETNIYDNFYEFWEPAISCFLRRV